MSDVLRVTAHGLACPRDSRTQRALFHVDPWRPVEHAVITHAHSDHARPGSARYYCAAPGVELLRLRVQAGAQVVGVPYGETLDFGNARVSFFPAGHVRGSAQVRVERGGQTWVVTGDYKRDADPTCDPFQVVACDTLITEATFALPIYRWDPPGESIGEIAEWWDENRAAGRVSVLFGYALGKAQRVLAELERHPRTAGRRALLHGALLPLTNAYRALGVKMLATFPATVEAELGREPPPAEAAPTPAPPTELAFSEGTSPLGSDEEARRTIAPARATSARGKRKRSRSFAGELILAPPSAAGTPWMRRFGPSTMVQTGFASGWMRIRGIRRRRGYDRGFVISDHADWPGLLRTIRESGARRVLCTHGYSETLASHLRELGLDAQPLATPYGAEDDDSPSNTDAGPGSAAP
ncbi:MAG: DNA ligase-associated DEXH box helicase [Planctomycetota bacterium]|nr:DNA ligase-associated DEXH box helicase [Planctomycetota bacterium]